MNNSAKQEPDIHLILLLWLLIIFIHFFTSVNVMIWYDTHVNCNWLVTRWQYYSAQLHTDNT